MSTIGVVLAGGLSSRMHGDKSQLVWQGRTLLEHSRSLLVDAGCSEVIISRNSSDDVSNAGSENQNSEYIADRFVNSGPLAGIDACLHYILSHLNFADSMLIMPVDMPLMSVQLLQNIQQQADPTKAVYYSAGRFPLMLPVNSGLAKQLADCLQQHNSGKAVSIRQLLTFVQCQILKIDKDQQTAFYNCNTPEEWQNISFQ